MLFTNYYFILLLFFLLVINFQHWVYAKCNCKDTIFF